VCDGMKKELKSVARREVGRRANFKKRNLGYFPLFSNPYPRYDVRSVDMHHINPLICIPLPHRTHMIVKGRNSRQHKAECERWIENIYCINVKELLDEKINKHISKL
jgi:hypothetical protein